MKKVIVVLLVLLASPVIQAATGVDYFHSDWDEAKKEAKEEGKPLYVHFTTEWCGWCRKIEEEVYRSEEGKKALEPFVPVSLDCTVRNKGGDERKQAEENKELLEQFGGSGYPFLVQVTADGEVFNSWSGYKPTEEFAEELEEALSSLERLEDFEKERESADKDSYSYNARAMEIYSDVKAEDKALQAAKKVLELDPENEKGNNATAAMIEVTALMDEGQWAEAGKGLNKVQEYDPDNQGGDWEEATQSFSIGVLRSAQSMSSSERQKSLSRARKAYSELIDSEAELEEPQLGHYLLGVLYAQQQQREKAAEVLEKAVSIDPESEMAQQIKAMVKQLESAE